MTARTGPWCERWGGQTRFLHFTTPPWGRICTGELAGTQRWCRILKNPGALVSAPSLNPPPRGLSVTGHH